MRTEGEFLTNTFDAAQQIAVLCLVHQRDNAIAHFQTQHVNLRHILPACLRCFGRRCHSHFFGNYFGGLLGTFQHVVSEPAHHTGQQQECKVRHARNQTHGTDDDRGQDQHLRAGEQLLDQLLADIFIAGHTTHHQTGSRRDDQRGNLRHQTVTDCQQCVSLGRGSDVQIVLQHTDHKTAHQIDRQNDDAGHGITAHEFARTVHRPVEVGFLCHFGTAAAGFVFTNQSRVQVGIDRHLLTRHRIQGETRAHFSDTSGTLGDNHKVDDHQNREHHDTNRIIAADQEVAERLNHLTRSIRAGVAFHQHHAGRCHIE